MVQWLRPLGPIITICRLRSKSTLLGLGKNPGLFENASQSLCSSCVRQDRFEFGLKEPMLAPPLLGAPCRACNESNGEPPPKMPEGYRTIYNKDGWRN